MPRNQIVVNARFLSQEITGVQRFSIEISRQLRRMFPSAMFVTPHNIVQKKYAKELKAIEIGTHTGHIWEQVDLPIWLRKKGSPLLVCLGNTAPVFYSNKIDTLHDITFKRFPATFSWKFRMYYSVLIPLILKSSKHVFSVSRFSIDEISSYYGYPKENMSVVYNAVDGKIKHVEDKTLKKEKYIFAVSSVKENKNFRVVLEAFSTASEQISDLKLFIAGDLKNDSFRKLDFSEYKNNRKIKFLGRISDEELIKYYSNAEAFLFPSLYEGFGIPVLEAQACCCPVISSNSSSLPEVLGNSALMCNPHSSSEFADAIIKLHSSVALRIKLIERGKQNVERFSWEESGKVIEKIVHLILQNHM